MKRKIIEIDESKCDGCGQCIDACYEGALALVDGKAKLVKDTFCDGLGACLGDCPTGALKIVERDAGVFDQVAAEAHLTRPPASGAGGQGAAAVASSPFSMEPPPPSQLGQWPVQLMLVPTHASFLQGSDLVLCADCVPFTIPDFHARYLSGRAVVVGCPKLDDLGHYAQKLAVLVAQAKPRRLTVVIMEVPCCHGLAQVALGAANESGLDFPIEIHVAGINGGIQRQIVRAPSAPEADPKPCP